MKTSKRKLISFLVLFLLSMTIVWPVHAAGEDDTSDKSHLNEWIKAITPVDTWHVTIKKHVPKVRQWTNYNLSSNDAVKDNNPVDLLPSWMSQGSCINWKAGFIFFQSEIINCETFTVKWAWMNNFSKQFFQEIIEEKKNELLEWEKEIENNTHTWSVDDSSDKWIESELGSIISTLWETLDSEQITETESSLESVISIMWEELNIEEIAETVSDIDTEDIEWSEDAILNILGGFDLWISEEGEWELENITESIEDSDLWIEFSWNDLEVNNSETLTESEESKDWTTSTWIVVWDVTSWEQLNIQVDNVLEKFLNPDEYIQPIKISEEVIEEDIVIEENDLEAIEREVSIDELFPKVYVNWDISDFTKSLFGPDVNNIMYWVTIDSDLLSWISWNYLAITLEKFREQKEIIEIDDYEAGNYQIFGLKWYPHYNDELKDMFEKFLDKKPSVDEINRVAKGLSAISFSFSTYTNRTVNIKTKNIFKNKLILDFQKLEKDYKNISKETTIRNFLLKR